MKEFFLEKKIRIFIFIFIMVFLLSSFVFIFINFPGTGIPKSKEEEASESFIFFSFGEKSFISKKKIGELKRLLGQHRLEKLTPVSMDFLEKYWPEEGFEELDEIREFFLRKEWRKKIGSETWKLKYSYTPSHQVAFRDIVFTFSAYSFEPLFLSFRLSGEGEEFLAELERKYSKASYIDASKEALSSLYWEDSKALLLVSLALDRYMKKETRVFLVYKENIHKFISEFNKNNLNTGFKIDF